MSVITYVPDSSKIIHETKVDFKTRSIHKPIILVQYDKSLPIVAVKLYLDNAVYTLPMNADVKIRWGKKDRTFVYKNVLGCNAARDTVYFDVDEQMSYFYGDLYSILELSIAGEIAGSSSIFVHIDKNPMQETDLESSSEYIELTQAVTDAQTAQGLAEAAQLGAETAQDLAELAQEAAEGFAEDAQGALDKIIDTGWQNLSLRNGWENDTNNELQIRKIGNLVEIRGRVNATNATITTVTIVPVGYRDVRDNIFIAFGAGTIMRKVFFYSSGGIDIVKESGDTSLRIHFIYMI